MFGPEARMKKRADVLNDQDKTWTDVYTLTGYNSTF